MSKLYGGKPHRDWTVIRLGRATYVRKDAKVLKLPEKHLKFCKYDMSEYVKLGQANNGGNNA